MAAEYSSLTPWSLVANNETSSSFLPSSSILAESILSSLSSYNKVLQHPLDDIQFFISQLRELNIERCDETEFAYTPQKLLGMGKTFAVYKAQWQAQANKEVALKTLRFRHPDIDETKNSQTNDYRHALETLLHDLRVLAHPWIAHHPNIVRLYAVAWSMSNTSATSFRPSLVMELADAECPTLDILLSTKSKSKAHELSLEKRTKLLTDIIEALTVIHASSIVHGDLKPSNILIFPNKTATPSSSEGSSSGSGDYTAKVSDFGFSRPFFDSPRPIGGTSYWLAPECTTDAEPDIQPYAQSVARDFYALGLIAWTVLFDESPFGAEGSVDTALLGALRKDDTMQTKLSSKISDAISAVAQSSENPTTRQHHHNLWLRIHAVLKILLQYHPQKRLLKLEAIKSIWDIQPHEAPNAFPTNSLATVIDNESARIQLPAGHHYRRPEVYDRVGSVDIGGSITFYPAHLSTLPAHIQAATYRHFLSQCVPQNNDNDDNDDDTIPVSAMQGLAACYNAGFGTAQNDVEASRWFLKAAHSGSDVAKVQTLIRARMVWTKAASSEFVPDEGDEYKWLLIAFVRLAAPRDRERGDMESMLEQVFPLPSTSTSVDSLALLRESFDELYQRSWRPWLMREGGLRPEFSAVRVGDVERLRELLAEQPALVESRMEGYSLLHFAVAAQKVQVVEALIQEFGMDPNETTNQSETSIDLAIKTGDLPMLYSLLALGANDTPLVNNPEIFQLCAMSPWGTASHYAIQDIYRIIKRSKDEAYARRVLNYAGKSSVGSGSGSGNVCTALQLAVLYANWDAFKILIALDADPNVALDTYSPLFLAVARSQPIVCALLLVHGAAVDERARTDVAYATPLLFVCSGRSIAFAPPPEVHILSATRPDSVSGGSDSHRTAIDPDSTSQQQQQQQQQELLLQQQKSACISILLFHKADINAQDYNGYTPLLHALRSGTISLATQLLNAGADIRKHTFMGETSAHIAADKPDAALLTLCLKHGADPLAESLSTATPLQHALLAGSAECSRVLLAAHPDSVLQPSRSDASTALHWAVSGGSVEALDAVLTALTQHCAPDKVGAFVGTKDREGDTALHVALQCEGFEEFVERLEPVLEAGVCLCPDVRGRIALHYAVAQESVAVAEILVRRGGGGGAEWRDRWGITPIVACGDLEEDNGLMDVLLAAAAGAGAGAGAGEGLEQGEMEPEQGFPEWSEEAEDEFMDLVEADAHAERQRRTQFVVEEVVRKRAELFPTYSPAIADM